MEKSRIKMTLLLFSMCTSQLIADNMLPCDEYAYKKFGLDRTGVFSSIVTNIKPKECFMIFEYCWRGWIDFIYIDMFTHKSVTSVQVSRQGYRSQTKDLTATEQCVVDEFVSLAPLYTYYRHSIGDLCQEDVSVTLQMSSGFKANFEFECPNWLVYGRARNDFCFDRIPSTMSRKCFAVFEQLFDIVCRPNIIMNMKSENCHQLDLTPLPEAARGKSPSTKTTLHSLLTEDADVEVNVEI